MVMQLIAPLKFNCPSIKDNPNITPWPRTLIFTLLKPFRVTYKFLCGMMAMDVTYDQEIVRSNRTEILSFEFDFVA